VITVSSGGIRGLEEAIKRFPQAAAEASKLAVNDTIDFARANIRKAIVDQIAVPPDAITPARFGVTRRATQNKLEAVLSASNQPLGLVRFARGEKVSGKTGVQVQVKKGGEIRTLKNAFFLPTPGAPGSFALAVRAPGGLSNSRGAYRVKGTDIYLLSGPSPNQLLANIAPKLLTTIQTRLNREFTRQYARLLRG